MARFLYIIIGALLINSFGVDGKNDILKKFSYVLKTYTFGMLRYLTEMDPTTPHTVSPVPVLCALAQLTANFSCPNDKSTAKATKFLNAKDGDEITEMFTLIKKMIDNDKENFGKVGSKAYSDKCKCFTEEFKSNLASICEGVTSNLDFKNGPKAAEQVNKWLERDHPEVPVGGAVSSMFEKKGVLFAFSWGFPYNMNHINNPTGLKTIDFLQNDGQILRVPAIYGKALIKYAVNEELGATFIGVTLGNGEDKYELIVLPNNTNDLPELVENLLSDIPLFDEIIASMKPMCVNFTVLIGEVHDVVNIPSEYLRKIGISLKKYGGILENDDCDTNVIDMLQKIDITPADVIQRSGSIDSPKCRDVDELIDVNVNRPGIYMIMSKSFGGPLGGGLFDSNFITGDDDLSKLRYAITRLSLSLLRYQCKKNPTRTHAVTAAPLVCIFAQMVFHSDGPNNEKLLKIINAESKEQVDRLTTLGQNILKRSNKTVDQLRMKLLADKSNPISTTFKQNFIKHCNGEIVYGEYDTNPRGRNNKGSQSSQGAETRMLKKNSISFKINRYFLVDINHRNNNPMGFKMINYHTYKGKVIRVMGFYATAYVKYIALKNPDAEVVRVSLSPDGYYTNIATPKNLEDMPQLIKRLTNIDEFNKIMAAMKPMCIKLTSVMTPTNATYNLNDYVEHLGISLKGYRNVFKNSGREAEISSITEKVAFSIAPIVMQSNNPPKCRKDDESMPDVHFDRPLFYQLMRKEGWPIMSGILTENSRGGDL